jgi:hypothetical protein
MRVEKLAELSLRLITLRTRTFDPLPVTPATALRDAPSRIVGLPRALPEFAQPASILLVERG